MIGLAVTFDLGRYHATAWDAHVNEATVEWPPSPWRVLRALIAAIHTNVGLLDVREEGERAVERLAQAPPPHFELPSTGSGHTRHYMPLAGYSPTRQSETSLVVDAFHTVEPGRELRVWWSAELDEPARNALARAAQAVGYLGRSESVCSMRLLTSESAGEPDALPADEASVEDDWDRIDLLGVAPHADDPIAVLSTSVTEMRRKRTRTPAGARPITYAVRRESSEAPAERPRAAGLRPTVAHLRTVGGQRPAMTDAVTVGHLLRSALQQRFGALNGGASSRVLSGHDGAGRRLDQHAHAHFLALPGSESQRVDSLVVWAREGFGPAEIEAIAQLRELRLRDAPQPVPVGLVALGHPADVPLRRGFGPSRSWRSLTPFSLPRHTKRRGGKVVDAPFDQVRRELSLRGLPEPAEISLFERSWMRFKRTRPGVSLREAAPVVGVRLRFEREVTGPLALGGLSHFGLGLFEAEE